MGCVLEKRSAVVRVREEACELRLPSYLVLARDVALHYMCDEAGRRRQQQNCSFGFRISSSVHPSGLDDAEIIMQRL